MQKIYYLSSCSTCSRIIKELNLDNDFEYHDIKSTKITEAQLEEMAKMSGSFESLFSRKAIKYREMGLAEIKLTENDYKKLILEEYTFLKRPVIIIGKAIFIGNTKEVLESLQSTINSQQ